MDHVPSRGRRGLVVVLSLGLTIAATAFAVWALSETNRSKPATPEPVTAHVSAQITARIEVGTAPRNVALGDGSIWITVNEFRPTESWAVVEIDPTTDEIVAKIPLPEASAIAFGEGSLWVSSSRQDENVILRIDPRSHEILRSIPIGRGSVEDLLVANAQLWAARSSPEGGPAGEVIRVDPATGETTARTPLTASPRDMLFTGGSLWVYGPSKFSRGNGWEAASVLQIDPDTASLVATYLDQEASLGGGAEVPVPFAAGDGGIWVADVQGRAVRIDAATGEVSRHDVPGSFDWPFATDSGGVWFGTGTESGG